VYRVEATHFLAQAATSALVRVDDSHLAAPELMLFHGGGRKQQVQISRIHIAIGEHLGAGECGKRADDTRLAGASLAAKNDDFFHVQAPRFGPRD